MATCIKCKKELPEGAILPLHAAKAGTVARKHKKRANGTGTVYKMAGKRANPGLPRKAVCG